MQSGFIRSIPGFTPAIANANNVLSELLAFRNPFFFNPFFFPNFGFLSQLYGLNGYLALANAYVTGSYGANGGYGPAGLGYGSGMGGYGMGGYGGAGNGYGGSSLYGAYANPYIAGPNGANGYGGGSAGHSSVAPAGQGGANADPRAVLAAAGVPVSGGKLDWPLGLRILPGTEPLRKTVDALFQVAATQAASGTMSTGLPLEMHRSVEKLENLLAHDKLERMTLSSDMYVQAQQFLRQLKQAARNVQTLAPAAISVSSASPIYSQQTR
jgi:hypothetical protein